MGIAPMKKEKDGGEVTEGGMIPMVRMTSTVENERGAVQGAEVGHHEDVETIHYLLCRKPPEHLVHDAVSSHYCPNLALSARRPRVSSFPKMSLCVVSVQFVPIV